MGITFGDYLIDSGYYDITPEQEDRLMNEDAQREIERLQGAKRRALAIADERSKENVRLRASLESIAGWRKVNIQGEYEHGLRDIIRSITDCAAAALDATTATSSELRRQERLEEHDVRVARGEAEPF